MNLQKMTKKKSKKNQKSKLEYLKKFNPSLEQLISISLFVITFVIYFSTMAPTVSFWDTGEFIATSYILGIPHPPGSPLYLLVGKLFSLIPISSDIAFRVNIFSPLISAATISLLFLICNQFLDRVDTKIENKTFKIYSSFIASLTFAFTHSHWFNAVETEVYAFSGFLTALVIYLVMRWSKEYKNSYHLIYLIFISYLIGLATGLHLLNLLTIPFIGLVIYFTLNKLSIKNFLLTIMLSLAIFFGVQNLIIKGIPLIAQSIGLIGLFVFIAIIIFLNIYFIKKKKMLSTIIMSSIVLIMIGYSTYFSIFIRSGQNPNIDENNPETVEEAISYLNRDQYGKMTLLPRKFDNLPSKISVVGKPELDNRTFSSKQNYAYMIHDLPQQLSFFWNYQIKKMYVRYFLWQFAGKGDSNDPFVASVGANNLQDGVDWRQFGLPIALIIGFIGFFYHFRTNKNDAFSLLILFLMTGLAIILYLNQDSPQPRERDYSYVASFMTFSIWISLGIYGSINFICDKLLEKSIKKKAINFMLVLFLFFMPSRMLLANYDTHDRTGNYIAWDMAYNMLQTCEPNAILFTNGDNDTFPLWYLQEVEKIRTDVVVANLSLLNTSWYVEQLKSRYDKNPFIKMEQSEIDNLDFKRWETKEVSINAPKDQNNQTGKIKWNLKPTYMDIALRIQDLMVLKIINDNNWERPIYFAVTVSPVSMLSLDEYLRMDGLAYKLVNNKSEIVNKEIISKNLLEFIGDPSWFKDYDFNKDIPVSRNISKEYQSGYLYRNLSNENVYIEPQIGRLIQNYRTGFARLSISYYLDEELESSEKVLLEMEKIMPSSIIPFPSKDLQYQIAQVYNGVGNKEKMKYHMKELIDRKDLELNDYILYGKTFIQSLEEYEESELIFETIYNNYNIIENSIKKRGYTSTKISPSEWNNWQESLAEIVFLLYISYKEQEKYDKAEALLNNWIAKNPNDENATKLLEEIIELKLK